MVTKTSHLPIRYFLALLWAHPILHISTIRVKYLPMLSLFSFDWFNSSANLAAALFVEFIFGWLFSWLLTIRGSADKSLDRPGMKQSTEIKLAIYSTYSPRSSTYFLARCSNLCKTPKKKKSEVCPSNQVSAAAMTSASDKNGDLSAVFPVQGTCGSPLHPFKPLQHLSLFRHQIIIIIIIITIIIIIISILHIHGLPLSVSKLCTLLVSIWQLAIFHNVLKILFSAYT